MNTNRTAPWNLLHTAVLLCSIVMGTSLAQEHPSPIEPESAEEGIRLNFRGVSLDIVLDYLSEEAGFIINREAAVQGTVDVWSHQPLTDEETVALLNTVLHAKGYAAIRNDRILTIVSKEEAHTRDLPVYASSDPAEIPRSDVMVTQIIPVGHANATQLLENLTPLLASHAIATANESSNAIVLTDTQANIHRMAEIVQALDTSITSISSLKVYMLQFSEASTVAEMINDLFENDDTGGTSDNPMRRMFAGMRGGPFGGGPGNDSAGNSRDSAALEAGSRVMAVADERTNALVVAAPDDLMPTISSLIEEIDTVADTLVEVRIFPLHYADAEEMAEVIENVFSEDASDDDTPTMMPRFGGRGGGRMPPGMAQASDSSSSASDLTVIAEADVRTNSVVVNAPGELMDEIASMITELDKNPARDQKVFIYNLDNADPEEVTAILQGMFEGSSNSSYGSGTMRNTTSTNSTMNSSTSSQSSNATSQSRF